MDSDLIKSLIIILEKTITAICLTLVLVLEYVRRKKFKANILNFKTIKDNQEDFKKEQKKIIKSQTNISGMLRTLKSNLGFHEKKLTAIHSSISKRLDKVEDKTGENSEEIARLNGIDTGRRSSKKQ
jgi:hypothetical protein